MGQAPIYIFLAVCVIFFLLFIEIWVVPNMKINMALLKSLFIFSVHETNDTPPYMYIYIYPISRMYKEQTGTGKGGMTSEQTDPLRTGTPITANRTRPDRTGRGVEQNGPALCGTAACALDRTGPDQTGLDRTGPDRTGPGRTGPDRIGPNRRDRLLFAGEWTSAM